MAITRRDFIKGCAAGAASASFRLPHNSEADTVQADLREERAALLPDNQPNILIILCDEMRYPPVYESEATKTFRHEHLRAQEFLRANGLSFERHYAASAACVPSRASLITGHYPSLHGVSQTTGVAKETFDPEVFWLDPDGVPTFGDYFRAAGYRTFWRGKWHISAADLFVPGTHISLPSYNPSTGERDADLEALYTAADRLDPYGFSGWIGPEPHGNAPLNSASSVPPPQRGRDIGIAEQTVKLIQELDAGNPDSAPWLVVCSFLNPHDIILWGLWVNLDLGPQLDFHIDDDVPNELFLPVFNDSHNERLATKPTAQASYQKLYGWLFQPILDRPKTIRQYYRYYYQLHKNVDEQMMVVLQALQASRFSDNTIVIFTSDHGDMLGSHGNLHQKFYMAYEEALRVPFIIWNKQLFPAPRTVDTLTNHVDLVPTLLGLAGIDPEAIRQQLALSHTDARPLVGRDLSCLVRGQLDPASFNDPVYFMTDDDVSRGPHQRNLLGLPYNSVVQPNHIETVVARLDDGNVWKYSRYWDNPQFWSSPGEAGQPGVQDAVLQQMAPTPEPEYGPGPILCQITVKATPKLDEFEMYNLTTDPMELDNKANNPDYSAQRSRLAEVLAEQRGQKRLIPCSGNAPGQFVCSVGTGGNQQWQP